MADIRLERPLPASGQGPRISELWAWTAIDPLTDTEGIISAKLRGVGDMPLVTSMKHMADMMEPLVREIIALAEAPRPVARLRHFAAVDE